MALSNFLANLLRRNLVASILLFTGLASAGLNIDNIRLNANTISTVNSNGDLTFDLNGTGSLILTDLTASRVLVLDASKKVSASAVTGTELGYLTGLSSGIQSQLDLKAPLASPTFSGTITTPLTASRALVTGASSELSASATTATELGYVSGVTSAIQTQMNLKAPLASPTFSGTITTPLTASRALVTGASSELGVSAVTATELGYLSGATSALQTQISGKVSSTGTSGGIPYYSSGTTTASSAALTADQLIKGGGAGAAPATFTACSDGQIIKYASGAPACGSDTSGAGTLTYIAKTSAFTADFAEANAYKVSGASFDITLPTAVGNSGKGFTFVHGGTNLTQVYRFDTNSGQTIGGVADLAYKLVTNQEALTILSDGANWLVTYHYAKTPEASATFTVGAVTTPPTYATTVVVNRATWYRDGKHVYIRYEFQQTGGGGANGTGDYLYPLPANMTIDTTYVTLATGVTWLGGGDSHGYFQCMANSTADFQGSVVPYSSTQFRIYDSAAGATFFGSAGPECNFGATTRLYFGGWAKFPITDWQQ